MLLEPVVEMRASKLLGGHPQDPVLARFFGGAETAAGVDVDENRALNCSAVWAATRILSGTGGMLPLKLYKRNSGGGKEEARDHPLWRIMHDSPNPTMSSMMFRSSRIQQQVNAGNAYAEIERDRLGRVVALWPIHCWRVQYVYNENREVLYEITNNSGPKAYLPAADMLHVPSNMSDDGICGKGVVQAARETIGFGLATERHGATYFGNGARPGIVVRHPKVMSDTARANFRKEWNEIYQGPDNAHKMALLSEGAEVTPITFSNEDSQFINTRQFNVEEIARWYGIPPHLLQHLMKPTYASVEIQSIEFVTYSLMPWLVLWEQELNRKLLNDSERETHFFGHVVDGLLRGDAATRATANQIQLQNGALNIDEWRSLENRNPLPGGLGQKHFVPLNMTTVENAGKVEDDPPEPPQEPEPRSVFTQYDAASAFSAITHQITQSAEEIKRHSTQNKDDLIRHNDRRADETDRRVSKEMAVQEQRLAKAEGVVAAGFARIEAAQHTTQITVSAGLEDARRHITAETNRGTATTEHLIQKMHSRVKVHAAYREALCQVLGRLLRKEAQAARRAANKPAEFLSWLDDFYVEHEVYFASEIGPVVRAVSAICGELRQPEQIAKLHCEQARSELLEASGVPPERFKDEVERCAVAWESTAPQALADEELSYLTGEQKCQRQSAA